MAHEKLVSELKNILEPRFFPSAAFSLGELKLGNLRKSDTEPSIPDAEAVQRLRQRLRLAINKIIHHNDISIGCFQDAIATGNSDQKDASCLKPDSYE
jgi:hypothetical protein